MRVVGNGHWNVERYIHYAWPGQLILSLKSALLVLCWFFGGIERRFPVLKFPARPDFQVFPILHFLGKQPTYTEQYIF